MLLLVVFMAQLIMGNVKEVVLPLAKFWLKAFMETRAEKRKHKKSQVVPDDHESTAASQAPEAHFTKMMASPELTRAEVEYRKPVYDPFEDFAEVFSRDAYCT